MTADRSRESARETAKGRMVDMRNSNDCLRACIASVFGLRWEDAPATEPPEGYDLSDRSWSQHNVVNDWLKARGLVAWTLEATPEDAPVLRRGRLGRSDGTYEPADFVWPYPFCTYHVGSGESPRGVDHSVVMKEGRIVHDPHPARDTTIDRIRSITVFLPRLGFEQAPTGWDAASPVVDDAAIERAAKVLAMQDRAGEDRWAQQPAEVRDAYMDLARRAFAAAALGGHGA